MRSEDEYYVNEVQYVRKLDQGNSWLDFMVSDIEIEIKDDGTVLWINTPNGCVFRACKIQNITLTDNRGKENK